MRALAGIATLALLCGCVAPGARPPKAETKEKASYNRRDMPPERGLFSGRDGAWTIYRNDADRTDEEPVAPPKRTTLSCERGHVCDAEEPSE